MNRLEKQFEEFTENKINNLLCDDLYNPIIFKLLILFSIIMFFLFSFWAYLVEVDEVSSSKGKIVPSGKVKKVQHISGGVVEKILVKDGEFVNKGDVLISFDRDLIQSKYNEAKLKLEALEAKEALLSEQIKIKEGLVAKGLNTRLSVLKLKSEYSDFKIHLSQSRESLKRAEKMLGNLELKSPSDGHVHDLSVNSQGEVIEPGRDILKLVPKDDSMLAEIEISPRDIGHIKIGSRVLVKFSSYDFGKFGGLEGNLINISPTTVFNEENMPIYKGIVQFKQNFIEIKGRQLPIIFGMTLSAEIITGKKKIIEYLLRPIFKSAGSALRER